MAALTARENTAIEPHKESILVNGIPTAVSKLLPPKCSSDVVAVVIPGNPGLIEYYDEFIASLFEASGGKLPVYGISHAGHSPVDGLAASESHKQMQHSSDEKDTSSTFTLKQQIEHKIAFLEEHISPRSKLVLIGHSIGAYIILQILKNEHIRSHILKAILLFPTIERMASTPSGVIVTPFANYFKWPAVLATGLASLIPDTIKKSLIQWWFAERKVHSCAIKATLKLVNHRTCDNILTMTQDEMLEVDLRDDQVISDNLDKLVFYYGATDHWVPLEYYQDIRRKFPDGEIYLCEKDFKHAFVLESSNEVACMVWEWIRTLVSN